MHKCRLKFDGLFDIMIEIDFEWRKQMAETITQWLTEIGLSPEIAVFIISMFPILELRGGLIAAALLKMPWLKSFTICLIGNILPLPFILLFIQKIFQIMKKFKYTRKIAEYFERKGEKNAAKGNSRSLWGKIVFVFCFVAIPLPGTGGWTGSLVASFMNLKPKYSAPAVCLGVVAAGIIMSVICYVFPELGSQLFGL